MPPPPRRQCQHGQWQRPVRIGRNRHAAASRVTRLFSARVASVSGQGASHPDNVKQAPVLNALAELETVPVSGAHHDQRDPHTPGGKRSSQSKARRHFSVNRTCSEIVQQARRAATATGSTHWFETGSPCFSGRNSRQFAGHDA
jgi:hypothetical protein